MKKDRSVRPGTVLLFLVMMTLYPLPAFPMIATLPFPELVGRSEIILIARVAEKKTIAQTPGKSGSSSVRIENIVHPERVLKGKWPVRRAMSFITTETLLDGKKVWREDALSFPSKGTKLVLFVRFGEGSKPVIVNGIQGLWPMDEKGRPLQMGYRYSIEDIEREISRPGSSRGKGL